MHVMESFIFTFAWGCTSSRVRHVNVNDYKKAKNSNVSNDITNREGRLHNRENVEGIQLLDNMSIVSRLQKKKTFLASLNDSAKTETVLAQLLV